jgi:hypothetical protein
MIPVLEAAWEIHQFLTRLGIQYAVIGGFAVQRWGEPRLTVDLDVTVSAPPNDPEPLIQAILAQFPSRVEAPIPFARRSRMVLVRAGNGCPIDISLALPGYEDEVMRRTVDYELEPGKVVRLASAEDLILHKAIAGRPQDIRDIEGIVFRQGDSLNTAYIRQWLQAFAKALDAPDLPERFERPWRRTHSPQHRDKP